MNKQTNTLKYTVTQKDVRQFIKIPFEVGEDVERIRIRYDYQGDNASSLPGKNKTVIDFALLDEKGKEVGATGSSYKDITISACYSSPGYDSLEINRGTWTIICGVYMLQQEELTITYTIDTYKKHYRWLKGDLHLHTNNSDGKLSVEELAKYAKRSNFDFITITDHNNFFHLKRLPHISGLTIIPGVELSPYVGHANIWGLEVPYTQSHCINNAEEFRSVVEEARQKGAIISLNHPSCNLCPWRLELDDIDFDAIEVWNGPMRPDNLKTYNYWHSQLVKGKRLVAVGGSDFHKDAGPIQLFARPTTYVYAYSNSKKDILDAIKKGKIAVTQNKNSNFIRLTCGQFVVRDTVTLTADTKVNVQVNLKRGHTLKVYNNDTLIYSHKSKTRQSFSKDLPVADIGFVRAEITKRPSFLEKLMTMVVLYVGKREDTFKKLPDYIYSFTNPIFFE